jgi:hypothetical protein
MILPTLIEGDQVQLFTDSGPELQFTLAGKVGSETTEFTLELIPLSEKEIEALGEDHAPALAQVAVSFPTYLPINSIVLLSIMKQITA